MLALLTPIDYGVLGLFVVALLGAGAYFSPRQKDTTEFFLASRSLGWLPLGMSLTAIFIGTLGLAALPAAAYDQGWKCWLPVLALWLVLPVVAFIAIPIYRGLRVVSIYEYLEQRFDAKVRLAASLVFVAWRMAWVIASICLPCEAIRLATGWNLPAWLVAVPIGGLATVAAFLGGARSGVMAGAIKAALMFAAAGVVIVAVWSNLDGGALRVAEIVRGLGRLEPVELRFSWNDPWTLWGALPFWLLAVLTFFIADQAAVQRLLAAKSENLARTAYLASALALSLLVPLLVYLGTGLLAFYYDHPQAMRPEWVVNVDGKTRELVLGKDGRPLLDASDPAHRVNFENIDRLVAEGRILQPNNKEPFISAAELVDPDTNEIVIEKLAMRRPNQPKLRGEIIVHRSAPQEMLSQFARGQLGWGAAGLVLAALVAAALAAAEAGLNSLATVIVRDLVIRFGWGKSWLARRSGKEPGQLTPADELQLARPLVLVLGAASTVAAAAIVTLLSPGRLVFPLIAFAAALGAPLTAVILLGMLTRRTTAAGALLGLLAGVLLVLAAGAISTFPAAFDIPPDQRIAMIWPTIGGFLVAATAGYVLSFVLGRRRTSADLRGLVAGCGDLGHRAIDEAIPLISVPEESNEIRWK
jgi:Na+/proline symporter